MISPNTKCNQGKAVGPYVGPSMIEFDSGVGGSPSSVMKEHLDDILFSDPQPLTWYPSVQQPTPQVRSNSSSGGSVTSSSPDSCSGSSYEHHRHRSLSEGGPGQHFGQQQHSVNTYLSGEDNNCYKVLQNGGGVAIPLEVAQNLNEFSLDPGGRTVEALNQHNPEFFDTSFSDLQTLLDLNNPQPEREPSNVGVTAEQEWTYLEPVAADERTTMAASQDNLQPPITSTSSGQTLLHNPPGQWDLHLLHSNSWPSDQIVAVKSEPPPDPSVSNAELLSSFASGHHHVQPHPPPTFYKTEPPDIRQSVDSDESEAPAPPKKSIKSDPEGQSRLCNVCGEKAGKHSYYGGQVCPSCRAFFRRSVQSRYGKSYSDVYSCSKDGNCAITLKTRKNCQYCRFKLCEQAGMKRSWVLADGERKKKIAEKAAKEEEMKLRQQRQVSYDPNVDPDPRLAFTEADRAQIQHYLETLQKIRNQTEELNPEVMDEIAEMVVRKETIMSPGNRDAIKRVLEQRTRLYALNLPEFTVLSHNDQICLLENNTGALMRFRMSTFFRNEFNWKTQLDLLMGQNEVSRLSSILTGLQLTEEHHLAYEQFFASPWCHSQEVERNHKNLVQKISRWVDDETTFCLLTHMILFSTENTGQLENVRYCQDQQLFFGFLLYRYLSSKHGREKARKKFTEGIEVISYCRELEGLCNANCKECR